MRETVLQTRTGRTRPNPDMRRHASHPTRFARLADAVLLAPRNPSHRTAARHDLDVPEFQHRANDLPTSWRGTRPDPVAVMTTRRLKSIPSC